MILSLIEIIHAVVMSAIVGWIFMDVFSPRKLRTPEQYMRLAKGFDWESFWFAMAIVAPSIILHELGHKFVAIGFGLNATFQAAWLWLGIGVIMKLIGGFIFFVPAFVSITGSAPSWVFGLTSLAGPAVNFLLFGLAKLIPWFRQTQMRVHVGKKERFFWLLLARINLFLGIFNLIPIPPFDGGQALRAFFFGG